MSSGSISLMTAHCVEPRRRHKRIKNPLLAGIVGGGDLRMPLDSHQPGMLRQFRGFNCPILGLGDYAKSVGQTAHGLVMPEAGSISRVPRISARRLSPSTVSGCNA